MRYHRFSDSRTETFVPTARVERVVEDALGLDLRVAFSEATHMAPPAEAAMQKKTIVAAHKAEKQYFFIG